VLSQKTLEYAGDETVRPNCASIMFDCTEGTFDVPLLQLVLADGNCILELRDMFILLKRNAPLEHFHSQ
jgi:hypothetical protein